MGQILSAPIAVVWFLAGPITYIICVVDTWSGSANIFVKILISLTLDAFLAAIWPITWVLWIVQEFLFRNDTPLSTVLGM